VAGVNIGDPQEIQKIYQRYLKAFKKGVFNYIKKTHIYSWVAEQGTRNIAKKVLLWRGRINQYW